MSATPTSRTLDYCRKQGWLAGVVERFLPRGDRPVRVDLFGFVDVVCCKQTGVLFVQATSGGNVPARVRKIKEECGEEALACLQAGATIEVWGWRKLARPPEGSRRRWWCRRHRLVEVQHVDGYVELVDIKLEDL